MGENMGYAFGLLILVVFGVPLLLGLNIDQNSRSQLLNVSTEMQQLVSQEGGVTDPVHRYANHLKEKGATVTFLDENGAAVDGKQEVGSKVYIQYKYKYQNVSSEKVAETSNTALISRR
jgi:hypothetical protein